MNLNLSNALVITLIGMVLVFLALLVLWALMEVTVQATAWYGRRHPEEEDEEEEEETLVETQNFASTEDLASLPPAASALKQQAAASAVAVALALHEEGSVAVEPQEGAYVGQPSAWKSVMRSTQLTQRSTQFTRKSRGNAR